VALTAAQADYLLEEWARWQRCDPLTMDKCIKPDPVPAREPVDEDRALRTDRVIAKLPGRLRFLVKLHYLDSVPIDVKARRMRIAREGYKRLLEGAQRVVGERLDQPPSRRHSVPR
jgi:DNA-directed RNA polymerase specialized sigma24 family protein